MKMNLGEWEDRFVYLTQDRVTAAVRQWTRRIAIWALFIGLTMAMTWPMALHLVERSVDHFDIFFNLWRLRWINHALTTAPLRLFDGNEFFPERGVLGFSDAVLVEGVFAMPLFAIGLPPMAARDPAAGRPRNRAGCPGCWACLT